MSGPNRWPGRTPRRDHRLTVQLSIEPCDRHRWLLAPTGAFVGGAIALRVFGLPPIDLHSPLHHIGIMDPLCGGTRGALALAGGDVAGAWTFNPLVVAAAGASIPVCLRSVVGLATHRWVNVDMRWRRPMIAVVAVVAAVLWANQQLHADLLAGETPRRAPATRVARASSVVEQNKASPSPMARAHRLIMSTGVFDSADGRVIGSRAGELSHSPLQEPISEMLGGP